jgi:Ser/Thr protein kinase RdoA (MazF antagonist)
MEPRIAARYGDELFSEIRRRYDLAPDQIRELGGFESYIYEFTRPETGEACVLRVGHSLRRSPDHFHGEIDWLHFLAERGADVAAPVRSPAGNFVEAFDDGHGDRFLTAAFLRAPGSPPWKQELPEDFPERYGRVIGKLHRITEGYQPSKPEWRRDDWIDQAEREIEPWIPKDDGVMEAYLRVKRPIAALPTDKANYNLIHQDAHMGNMFVDDGRITLFDFDDCVYGWFIYDIAMVIFYRFVNRDPSSSEIGEFCRSFLGGYRQESPFDPSWLGQIPLFLKLREIDLYAILHRSFGGDDDWPDAWSRTFMSGRREKILNDVPYLDFDWERLS